VPNEPTNGGNSWAPWRNFNRAQGGYRADDRTMRGEWQRAGHGPSASRDYGWEYQGGYPHDASVMRTEAGMGDAMGSYFAQRRSGGLPRGRDRFDVDNWGGPLGGRGYDREMRGRGAGYDREMMRRDMRARYGMDYLRDRWG
jgi:hypothetical protein